MKKLERIKMNPDKLMKDEDLFRLKGGYEGCGCVCYNWDFQVVGAIGGDVTALTCNVECLWAFGSGFGHWSC